MIIGVLKEPSPETRISLTPETVSALKKKGYSILVETNAGDDAFCSNEQFIASGADIADRSKVLQSSDILLSINAPRELGEIPAGKVMIGTFSPLNHPEVYRKMADGKMTVFSLDMLPRTTRAQTMDVLSSQANIAGYK